jgi:hypothetical protein
VPANIALAARVRELPWYHTIDLGYGVGSAPAALLRPWADILF